MRRPDPGRRNRPRSRERSREGPGNPDYCYYHRTFGDRAYKCQSPCKWMQGNGTTRPLNSDRPGSRQEKRDHEFSRTFRSCQHDVWASKRRTTVSKIRRRNYPWIRFPVRVHGQFASSLRNRRTTPRTPTDFVSTFERLGRSHQPRACILIRHSIRRVSRLFPPHTYGIIAMQYSQGYRYCLM